MLKGGAINFSLVNNISVFKSIRSGDKSCKFLIDIYAMHHKKALKSSRLQPIPPYISIADARLRTYAL